MKALVVGANGQLGRCLQQGVPAGVELAAYDSAMLDVTDRARVLDIVRQIAPEIVLNAAAYTAVDKAESEEDKALAVNARAVGFLAEAARNAGARLVHVSTDFVFDGTAGTPYRPDAPTAPPGAYGRTKRAGEEAAGTDALIVRTAWVYGPTGGNFVRTMLRLMAGTGPVRVVADQVGTPTYAPGLAAALWTLARAGAVGIHHYTDSGVASWYDFAVAIQEEALAAGLLEQAVPIVPIATADYPTPARRPSYSVLDKRSTIEVLGAPPPHWRVRLRDMIEAIKTHG